MRMQVIVLFGTLFVAQPVLCLYHGPSTVFANQAVVAANDKDAFDIDFDVIDQELASLGIEEKKPEKSWWITEQIKHIGTKVMIKALLGYVALQEFCSDKWDASSKKVRALFALCYRSKSNKKPSHEPQKS